MPRVVGVDPGTQSFDLCGLADGRVFLEASIPAEDARRAPAALVDRLEAALPLDLVAAPSGYGLPLVPVAELQPAQLDILALVRPEDRHQPERVGGLRAVVELMRARGLPAVLLYVEEDNTVAVSLYERSGFTRHTVDVSWRRTPAR